MIAPLLTFAALCIVVVALAYLVSKYGSSKKPTGDRSKRPVRVYDGPREYVLDSFQIARRVRPNGRIDRPEPSPVVVKTRPRRTKNRRKHRSNAP